MCIGWEGILIKGDGCFSPVLHLTEPFTEFETFIAMTGECRNSVWCHFENVTRKEKWHLVWFLAHRHWAVFVWGLALISKKGIHLHALVVHPINDKLSVHGTETYETFGKSI